MHPVFNPVTPYHYLLPNLYLYVADNANPDLFVCGSRTWISLDIAHFSEEHCQPSSGSACPKTVIGPHCWGREGLLDHCDSSTTVLSEEVVEHCKPPHMSFGPTIL